jgi:hypothetical protein
MAFEKTDIIQIVRQLTYMFVYWVVLKNYQRGLGMKWYPGFVF